MRGPGDRMRWAIFGGAVLLGISVGLIGDVDSDDGPGSEPPTFCTQLDRLSRNDPFTAFGDRATEAEIDQAFTALAERADDLLDAAPAEARGTAREYAESTRALQGLLAEADGDPSQVDPREYRAQRQRYIEAAQLLERYLTTEC